MSLERSDVVGALTKKGFRPVPGGDHDYFFLYVGDKKQAINTHVSRGKRYKTLGDDLVTTMARQVKLTTPQFREFVACLIDEPKYLELLETRGVRLNA